MPVNIDFDTVEPGLLCPLDDFMNRVITEGGSVKRNFHSYKVANSFSYEIFASLTTCVTGCFQ